MEEKKINSILFRSALRLKVKLEKDKLYKEVVVPNRAALTQEVLCQLVARKLKLNSPRQIEAIAKNGNIEIDEDNIRDLSDNQELEVFLVQEVESSNNSSSPGPFVSAKPRQVMQNQNSVHNAFAKAYGKKI